MADNNNEQAMPSILACDCGNTNIRIAIVCGEDVTEVQSFKLGDLGDLGPNIANLWEQIPQPRKIVACSVNKLALNALEAAAMEATGQEVVVVGRDIPLPIEQQVETPDKTGVDRLCAAVAAFDRLGVACIVIDCGTAMTIDCVNDEGVFLGGAIMPGLSMQAKALAENTALLPQVELAEPTWTFGKNTDQAIIGGIVFGARGAMRLFIESYATELGSWPLVILTGGDSELLCKDCSESELVQAIVPDLTLRGVAAAFYKTFLN